MVSHRLLAPSKETRVISRWLRWHARPESLAYVPRGTSGARLGSGAAIGPTVGTFVHEFTRRSPATFLTLAHPRRSLEASGQEMESGSAIWQQHGAASFADED